MNNACQEFVDSVRFGSDGLVPVVTQQFDTGEVLMVAWMDRPALVRTLETREATYFSRSRNEQWVKGATSGNTQTVVRLAFDCDADTVLLQVDQRGGA